MIILLLNLPAQIIMPICSVVVFAKSRRKLVKLLENSFFLLVIVHRNKINLKTQTPSRVCICGLVTRSVFTRLCRWPRSVISLYLHENCAEAPPSNTAAIGSRLPAAPVLPLLSPCAPPRPVAAVVQHFQLPTQDFVHRERDVSPSTQLAKRDRPSLKPWPPGLCPTPLFVLFSFSFFAGAWQRLCQLQSR